MVDISTTTIPRGVGLKIITTELIIELGKPHYIRRLPADVGDAERGCGGKNRSGRGRVIQIAKVVADRGDQIAGFEVPLTGYGRLRGIYDSAD